MSGFRASVVITNHDYADFVGVAIESARSQVGGGVQVIVVDDGSSDASLDVIGGFDGVEVVAQANGGQGAAMNAGFERVTAPIVFFLDADDVLAPDVVNRAEGALVDPSVVRVQFRLGLIDASGVAIPGEMPPVGTTLAAGDLRRELVRFPDDIVWQPTSGNAFRASVLDRIMPIPPEPYRICADYYLSNLTPVHGAVAVLDALGGSYRIHGSNADYSESISPARIRANVERTSITHGHLIAECRRAELTGLPGDPDAILAVTALAMRLISLRVDPGEHPVTTDTRLGLARLGARAAWGRFDQPPLRRLTMAVWFAVMSCVPGPLVRRCARPFVCVADPSAMPPG